MNPGPIWLQIRSGRQVLLGTAAITAIAVAAPVLTIFCVVTLGMGVAPRNYLGILAIAAIIPLLIAPPISLFALSILKVLTLTLDRLDAYIQFDPLTGTLTRAYFLGQVRERLAGPGGGALLMVDADHFKVINDTYGHEVGDAALKRLAEVLRAASPVGALVGRLGGEEFGVFLSGAGYEAANEIANGLCDAMRDGGKFIAEHEISLTFTIGGAVHLSRDSIEQTMRRADAALYAAKRTGRDQVQMAGSGEGVPPPHGRGGAQPRRAARA